MNEIERAIEYLEPISKHPTMTGAYCEHLKVAIEALREQAERSKGCEYCGGGEELAYGHDSLKRVGSIYIDKNLLVADLYSESMAVAVCYCPMCGKRLEVEHE